jgi:hypothetical protein
MSPTHGIHLATRGSRSNAFNAAWVSGAGLSRASSAVAVLWPAAQVGDLVSLDGGIEFG